MKVHYGISSLFAYMAFMHLGCISDDAESQSTNWASKSLIAYQLPITIRLPENTNIQKSNVAYEKGVVIIGDNVNMRVDMFQEYADSSYNAAHIKEEVLAEKKSESDFVKLLVNDSSGFVYETQDEELGSNFHFFFVSVFAKNQVEFREGVPKQKNFTIQEVMKMYEAAKEARIQN